MPGGDRTGPAGMGPMTGRRAGYCAGLKIPGVANPGRGPTGLSTAFNVGRRAVGYLPRLGRRIGFGRGHGLGRNRWS